MDIANDLLTLKKRGPVQRLMLAFPHWVTPNHVTLLGAALLVPMTWLLVGGRPWAALGIYALSTLCDFVDGALALARKQAGWPQPPRPTTLWQLLWFGEFLDAFVDKFRNWVPLFAKLSALGAWYALGTITGSVIAALLTAARVAKFLATRAETETAAAPAAVSVAATKYGKWKIIPETAAVLAAFVWLATGRDEFRAVGAIALWLSLPLALRSLRSQIPKT